MIWYEWMCSLFFNVKMELTFLRKYSQTTLIKPKMGFLVTQWNCQLWWYIKDTIFILSSFRSTKIKNYSKFRFSGLAGFYAAIRNGTEFDLIVFSVGSIRVNLLISKMVETTQSKSLPGQCGGGIIKYFIFVWKLISSKKSIHST